MTKTLVWMSLPEIQATVTESVDFGPMHSAECWLNLVKSKAADSQMGALLDSIIVNGWDEDFAIPILDGEIQDGHHRLAAAILLCSDEIPVLLGGCYWDGDSCDERNRYNVHSKPFERINV